MKEYYYKWGPLYYNHVNYNGSWMKDIIKKISTLSYEFKEESEYYPNGIYIVSHRNPIANSSHEKGEPLGLDIAKFIISSYITKHTTIHDNVTEETFTTPIIINLVLYEIDKDGSINQRVIDNVVTILNHPHFKGCNNMHELQKKIPLVDKLNDRYNGTSSSSDEEDLKEIEIEVQKDDPRHPEFLRNIFLD